MISQGETSPRKRSICYFAPDVAIPSPRGSTVHVVELAKSLTDLGHDVHVISRRISKKDPKVEQIQGFTVHRVYRWILKPESRSSFTSKSTELAQSEMVSSIYYFYLLTIFRLYVSLLGFTIIRKYKLQLIIERETSFGAGAMASLFAGKPMVLEIIGPRYSRMSAWRSRSIFYYTESMLRKWVDKHKCIPVPAGVNLSLFHEDERLGETQRKKLGFQSDYFVIGYVGTFQDWHGVEDLLKAMTSLKQRFPNVRALLVGPHYEQYQRISESIGVSHICLFTGAVDYNQVPAYTNSCDIMVALYNPNANSLRKKYGIGSPLKILEYMACGKPVISTRVEPITHVFHDNDDCVLVEPSNSTEVEKSIVTLIMNKNERLKLAAKGKQLVESKYSWNTVASIISSRL